LIETRPVTRVAVTTTSADYNASGPTNGVDAGEAGSLTGTPVDLAEPGAAEALRQTLLCDTVYWRDIDLVSDRGYEEGADGSCPLPDGGEIPREYLNCVCGDGDWVTDEGAGNEEGLESAFDALCRASGAVPAACTDEYSPLTEADLGTSANFWREGADAWILLISDEGDGSRRIANTDADPSVYVDLFDETGRDIDFFALIPAYEDSDGSCLDSAQTWGVERYQAAADATGGEWAGLTEIDADCTPNDVAKLATDLLLGG
jgi:hypothetical protein